MSGSKGRSQFDEIVRCFTRRTGANGRYLLDLRLGMSGSLYTVRSERHPCDPAPGGFPSFLKDFPALAHVILPVRAGTMWRRSGPLRIMATCRLLHLRRRL